MLNLGFDQQNDGLEKLLTQLKAEIDIDSYSYFAFISMKEEPKKSTLHLEGEYAMVWAEAEYQHLKIVIYIHN